jgi:hypothetical protein
MFKKFKFIKSIMQIKENSQMFLTELERGWVEGVKEGVKVISRTAYT